MNRTLLLALPLLLAMRAVGMAQLIDVGGFTLLPNTPGQVIDINVTGGGPIQSMDFIAQIGDGGPYFSLPISGPLIMDVDITGPGTIFSPNHTPQQPLAETPQKWWVFTTTQAGNVTANGLLGRITIDTTGWFGGTWPLLLSDPTVFYDEFGGEINPVIIDGWISVPEPSSLALTVVAAGLALAAAARRRCRRAGAA